MLKKIEEGNIISDKELMDAVKSDFEDYITANDIVGKILGEYRDFIDMRQMDNVKQMSIELEIRIQKIINKFPKK